MDSNYYFNGSLMDSENYPFMESKNCPNVSENHSFVWTQETTL